MERNLMLEAEFVVDDNDEELRVLTWRTEQLHRLGLPPILAAAFAGVVDWHEIAVLVAGGCPLELALDIAR